MTKKEKAQIEEAVTQMPPGIYNTMHQECYDSIIACDIEALSEVFRYQLRLEKKAILDRIATL